MSVNITTYASLAFDPELQKAGDKDIAKMRLILPNKTGKEGNKQFVDGEAWEQLGLNCVADLKKGDSVILTGRLQTDEWEKDGEKRSKMKITISGIGKQIPPWPREEQDLIKEARHEVQTLTDEEPF